MEARCGGAPVLALGLVLAWSRAAAAEPTAPAAAPMSAQAREHLDRGLRRYDAQDYAGAIAEFQVGYAIDPRPEFLYALGQAQRLAGDCARSIAAFESFLRSGPPRAQRQSAQRKMDWCRRELVRTSHDRGERPLIAPLGATSPADPAARVGPPAPAPVAVAEQAHRPAPAPHASLRTWLVAGLAAALGVAGAATWVSARAAYADYRSDPFDRSLSRATTRATWSYVLLGACGAAAAGWGISYHVDRSAARAPGAVEVDVAFAF